MASTIIRVGAFDPDHDRIRETINQIAGKVETGFDFDTEQRDFIIDSEADFARIASALTEAGILTYTVAHR